MWGFKGKKKTADTFVEATGGGWGDSPDTIPIDGGSHADFVNETLRRAKQHAVNRDVKVGEEFEYTITDIPRGISGPHEIVMGLMMQSGKVGLRFEYSRNEEVCFTRMTQ